MHAAEREAKVDVIVLRSLSRFLVCMVIAVKFPAAVSRPFNQYHLVTII